MSTSSRRVPKPDPRNGKPAQLSDMTDWETCRGNVPGGSSCRVPGGSRSRTSRSATSKRLRLPRQGTGRLRRAGFARINFQRADLCAHCEFDSVTQSTSVTSPIKCPKISSFSGSALMRG